MSDETEPNKTEKVHNLTIYNLQDIDAQLDEIAREIAQMKAELQRVLTAQEQSR